MTEQRETDRLDRLVADLILTLDGLPEESAHCARLAVSTLRQTIALYHQERRQDPSR